MRSPGRRALPIQLLIYLAVGVLAAAAAIYAIDVLRARGIQAGFGFLKHTAGFEIGFKLIAYDSTDSYTRAFVVALLNTLLVSGLSVAMGTAIGLLVAVARLAPIPAIRAAGTVYVEAFRNTPLLFQLLALYAVSLAVLPPPRDSYALGGWALVNNRGIFLPSASMTTWAAVAAIALVLLLAASGWLMQRSPAPRRTLAPTAIVALVLAASALASMNWVVPKVEGFNVEGGIALVPELGVLVVALSLYSAAFIAETFRSGFLAVPSGQWQAAFALGLDRAAAIRGVVLPQALRACLPALASQYINVIKASSLAAAVGFPDLMQVFGKTTLNQTGQAVEVIGLTMAVYLVMSMTIAGAVHWVDRRAAMER
ncbi:MAG: ABC transporter permease subunit [Caldimonas sp.]